MATTGGGRPTIYKNSSGKRVPGVTTVLGRFKDAGGLIHWAWELGCNGQDYRKVRDDAGGAGSIAHGWIDDDIHGRELRAPPEDADQEMLDKARSGLKAFRQWRDSIKLEIIDTETPLVSDEYGFGGTYDALGIIGDEVILVDWKTSNRVYSEYIAQLAAYRQLVRERTFHDPAGARLLRVGKELADFADHSFPSAMLDLGWARFQSSLHLYEADAKLRKAAGL
jgi:hypothetical protein